MKVLLSPAKSLDFETPAPTPEFSTALFLKQAEKINKVKEMFGLTRYIAHMDVGAPNHEVMMKSIELFGTKVAEKVR